MNQISIAIVGIGPWGLAVLDRLIAKAKTEPYFQFHVAVVDLSKFGSGMHDPAQPSYLLLNTITSQIDSFSNVHFGEPPLSEALDFFQWVKKHHDPDCSPNTFLPRKVFGEYLRFVYSVLKANVPQNMQLTEHASAVRDLVPVANNMSLLTGSAGLSLKVNHAFVCTGHGLPLTKPQEPKEGTLAPYPVRALPDRVEPGSIVGVKGMGLTAVDVVSALTEGVGGRFEKTDEGQVKYIRSGREPTIYLFSRTATPFSCRPNTSLNPLPDNMALFCDDAHLPTGRQLDFYDDVLPLIAAEMWAAYAVRSALLKGGPQAATQFQSSFNGLSPFEVCERARAAYPEDTFFDPIALLLGNTRSADNAGVSAREHVVNWLRHDVAEAQKGEANSPYKHALEILRVRRNFIRSAVNFQRLNPKSQLDFFTRIAPRISQLIVGPPLSRGREWLALESAGILNFSLGPNPEMQRNSTDGLWRVRSQSGVQPSVVQFNHMVRGYLSDEHSEPTYPPLLANMTKSGMVSLIKTGNFRRYLVDKKLRPVDVTGVAVSGVSMLGMPTEGTTYFNHYLPSPNSRAQAFEQADIAIDDMLETVRTNNLVQA